MSCEKHKRLVEKYDGSLEELAIEIGDLHYESLRDFIGHLSNKINNDADKDSEAGRTKLGSILYDLSISLEDCEQLTDEAWIISKPYMK